MNSFLTEGWDPHIANCQQAAVKEKQQTQEGKDDPNSRKPDANLCDNTKLRYSICQLGKSSDLSSLHAVNKMQLTPPIIQHGRFLDTLLPFPMLG